jgi:hypothetical protein
MTSPLCMHAYESVRGCISEPGGQWVGFIFLSSSVIVGLCSLISEPGGQWTVN